MSRVLTQTDVVIEIIKSPEELVELANTLLKLAYSTECTGISLSLGLGFYGAIEQSYQIRFINQDLLEETDEDDEQEYDDDEEDVEQELETDENSENEDEFTASLRDLFAGMGFLVADLGEGVVDQPEVDTTDYSDVSHLYSGQV